MNENNNITYEEFRSKLPFKDKDTLATIDRAYEFAKEVHKGGKRTNGEDYIVHPLEVANILLELNVDETTIIAALLHETLNKRHNVTKEDLERDFGSDVSRIVYGLSKLKNLKLNDESESSAIYLRKVLVGLSEDPRVLYIKLADRLHNMRTIYNQAEDIQKKKAIETMNVLVPIAHRLGINYIKSELENICLKIMKPNVYQDILDKLDKTTLELNDNLINMKESLTHLLKENHIKHEIKGRVKSVYSIYNKLSNGKKWSEIYDILALRIFVNSEEDCYTTISLIHSKFRVVPNRFKDYIANPKENMYQSLHTTIFGADGEVYEIQVRTYEMDEIAEKGIASHWSYKEKGTKKVQAIMEQKLEMFRNIIESQNEKDEDYDDSLNTEFLTELIYVFTPKGDVIELPKGSTPIDFAYRIHSKVGDTTTGAIVNDQIVPLSYELSNNDVVKVITTNTATPNKDWLNFAKTPQARSKIKSYFSKIDRENYINKGKNIFEKELHKRHLSINEVLSEDNLNKIFRDLKFDDLDDLYLSIGSLRYTAGYIINLATIDKNNLDDMLIERFNNTSKDYKSNKDIIIDGNDNILYNLAKCCYPVKGDEIVGFITKGDGITIHRKNCPNVPNSKDRLIDVSWNEASESTFITEINVSISNQNTLTDIVNVATKEKIHIIEIHNNEFENNITCTITLRVKDRSELEHFINKITQYKGIRVVNI